MPIVFNGVDVKKVIYNGVDLNEVYHDGVLVFSSVESFNFTTGTPIDNGSNKFVGVGQSIENNIVISGGGYNPTTVDGIEIRNFVLRQFSGNMQSVELDFVGNASLPSYGDTILVSYIRGYSGLESTPAIMVKSGVNYHPLNSTETNRFSELFNDFFKGGLGTSTMIFIRKSE